MAKETEEAAQPSLADILAAINGLVNRIDAVEERVKEQAESIPQMVPMPGENAGGMFGGLQQAGDTSGGTLRQVMVGTDGMPRPVRSQVWASGTRVRFSPESETAQAMKGKRDPEGLVGTIRGVHFVNDQDEVKYRVAFPGLTTPRGDGFYAHELVPA